MRSILFLGALSMLLTGSVCAQTRISLKPGENQLKLVTNERSGISLVNSVSYIDVNLEKRFDRNYVELQMTGYATSYDIGNPDLPVLNKLIEVPLGAEVAVRVSNYEEQSVLLSDYDINLAIIPAQEPVSKSADLKTIPFTKNEQVYATNTLFSNPLVRFHEVGIMRGVRIGRIEISPLAYNPVTGQIKIYNNMEIEVRFNNGDLTRTDEMKARYYSPAFTGILSGLLNYNSVKNSKDMNIKGTPLKFVIISNRMFEQTLTPFVEWKQKQGFNTIVRYTDEPEIGTTVHTIKNYLKTLYTEASPENPAPSFIMLVGDREQVPAFNGHSSNHISDTYYVTYDGPSDRISDVNIGRMSAKTVAQLEALIEKTLIYEKFEMEDPSYLSKSLLVSGVDAAYASTHGNGALNYILHYHNEEHGITPVTFFYPASSASGVSQQIISNVNTGIAWGNYTAHCNSEGWHDPSFVVGSISQLTNTGKYNLLIGNCCLSSKFDDDECFAEAITRASGKGAIGYIGGTNSTYWSEDYWWATGHGTVTLNPQIENFGPGAYDALFHENLQNDDVYATTQSQLVTAGCLAVEASNTSRKLYYWEIYHMMGDPTLTPYIGNMPSMTPSHLETLLIGISNFTISDLPPKSYVALTDNGEIKFAGFSDSTGTIEVTFEPFTEPTDASLVITTPFYRPYMTTITIVPGDTPYVVNTGATINEIVGNNDGNIDFNETVKLKVTLKNIGAIDAANVTATLRCDNPYVTIIDSVANCGNINKDSIFVVENDFTAKIAKDIPDNTKIEFTVVAKGNNDQTWITKFKKIAFAPILKVNEFNLVEITGNNNQIIDAGETIKLRIPVVNTGHSASYAIKSVLISGLTAVTVENDTTEVAPILPSKTSHLTYTITTDESISMGTSLDLTIHIISDIFTFSNTRQYTVGAKIEDFESGNFTIYPWDTTTSSSWTISNGAYHGEHCARSGNIGHNQTSTLSITTNVTHDDSISFYRKVSSEARYDKLFFKIDGNTLAEWSGEESWEKVTFPCKAGNRTLTWQYSKDYSTVGGSDAAWIDYIVLPNDAQAPSNEAPIFDADDVTEAVSGIQYSAVLIATDPEGTSLEYTALMLPEWLEMVPSSDNTVRLIGTPTDDNAKKLEHVIVTASDGTNVTPKIYTITVKGLTNISAPIAKSTLKVYPNPTKSHSIINYFVSKATQVQIDILSMKGQVVKRIIDRQVTSGGHQTSVNFAGLDSGVYIVRLTTNDTVENTFVVVQ